MTPAEYISASLHLGVALLLLWILIFHFWRQYRVDALRETLFRLRGELFDYAAKGGVSFDSPAYAKLRVVMNGMIRFAHKFTLSRFAMIFLFRKRLEGLEPPDPLADWRKAVSSLPEESQKTLQSLHDSVLSAISWHIMTGFPLLFVLLFMNFIFSVVRFYASGGATGKAGRIEEVGSRLPGVDVVEIQAINTELEERQDYPREEPTFAVQ